MKIRAYAKINLALDVVSKRADGYHELDMIMAPITLHDLIYIDRIEKGIEITSNNYRMDGDDDEDEEAEKQNGDAKENKVDAAVEKLQDKTAQLTVEDGDDWEVVGKK